MTRRIVAALLLLCAAAAAQQLQRRSAAGAPQTARQALIAMLTAKDEATFERYLPTALVTRMSGMKPKDAKTGKSKAPQASPFAANKDVQFFPAGPTFLVYSMPELNQRLELVVDRDEATANGNEMEFSFRMFKDGKEAASALIPKFLVRMKQEEGTWRLAEAGLALRLQLDDGEKLDELMQDVMTGMAALQPAKRAPAETPQP